MRSSPPPRSRAGSGQGQRRPRSLGGAAAYRQALLSGIQLAVDEINAQGLAVNGKKVKLEVVALSTTSTRRPRPPSTPAWLQQQHKTPAVFVPHSGRHLRAAGLQRAGGSSLVMAYSSVPCITDAGNKLTIRIPPAYTGYIEPFIKAEIEALRQERGAGAGGPLLRQGAGAGLRAGLGGAGGKIVAVTTRCSYKATDFYTGVSRAIAEKPDVMFVGGPLRADRAGGQAGAANCALQGRLHRRGPGQDGRDGQGHQRARHARRLDRRDAAGFDDTARPRRPTMPSTRSSR